MILFFVLVAIFAPLIAPHNPLKIYSGKGSLPPAWEARGPTGKAGDRSSSSVPTAWAAMCSAGRSTARASPWLVGLIPAMIILLIGVVVGLVAGYYGGGVDKLLMRFADIIYAFPDLLFFIIVMAALRETPIGQVMNGLLLLFVALSIVSWVDGWPAWCAARCCRSSRRSSSRPAA